MSAATLTVEGLAVEVSAVQRHEEPGRAGWFGRVSFDGGRDVLNVSRLDGEDGWTVDARFRGSLPVFVNGFGARYLRTDAIRAGAIASQLDALAGLS